MSNEGCVYDCTFKHIKGKAALRAASAHPLHKVHLPCCKSRPSLGYIEILAPDPMIKHGISTALYLCAVASTSSAHTLTWTHYSSRGYQAPRGAKPLTHKHSSLAQRKQFTGNTTTTCFPSAFHSGPDVSLSTRVRNQTMGTGPVWPRTYQHCLSMAIPKMLTLPNAFLPAHAQ